MASSSGQGREKRSKANNDKIDSLHVSWFNRTRLNEFNAACKYRNVITERLFDRKMLEEMNFRFLSKLDEWGWWNLLSCEKEVWENAVRVFYFNGRSFTHNAVGEEVDGGENNDNIRSTVLGTEFSVDKDEINRLLGFRMTGETNVPHDFSYVAACRVIYGNDEIEEVKGPVKDLDAHTRILHLMVCQCLNLRKGGYTKVSKEDMYFMYKIIIGDPPNLGAFIIRRMNRAIGWSKNENTYSLPYGRIVSLLIGQECSVPSYEATSKTVTLGIVDKASFHKMNFKWNERAKEWEKTQPPNQEAAPEPDTEAAAEVNEESAGPSRSAAAGPSRSAAAGPSTSAAAGTSSAVPEPGTSNAGLAEVNTKLEWMVEAMLGRMDAGFAKIEAELGRIVTRQDRVETKMNALAQLFMDFRNKYM